MKYDGVLKSDSTAHVKLQVGNIYRIPSELGEF